MISLLRRNRKQNKNKQGSLSQSLITESPTQQSNNLEIYNDNSLDSLVFAASLGLVSTQHHHSHKDVMLIMQSKNLLQQQQQQQQQQMEFHCRFCGKGYRWKSTMRRHETLECGDKPPSFQCPECPYKARQRGNLTVHQKRHHQKD